MNRTTKIVAAAAVAAALAIAGGVAAASGGDDTATDEVEQPLTGDALDKASSVARDHAGGGNVTETEIEDAYYEVELTRDDGTEVDVHLNHDFRVVPETDD